MKMLAAGSRVTVIRDPSWDGPWQVEFRGRIDDLTAPEPVLHSSAREGELAYWVVFDEPQFDSSGDGPFRKALIWDRYLKPDPEA
ncbi:ferrous iron transport protein A [Streptomyces sp. NPDC007883]|uniref:ferrous iron transport protein A n=2 Tax=unclassified Streptomyces TaxID=2593676 RepID=UPI00340533E7